MMVKTMSAIYKRKYRIEILIATQGARIKQTLLNKKAGCYIPVFD
jgi:hypothetical protein